MKVRIYKSPDGNGKYLNKTGQFLEKAQKGKIVKNILQYGKQLVMNFDEADKIQKATKLAKAIDKSNKAGRTAGAIKYGEGIKKTTTASSKIQIKNPAFFQNILNSSNLSLSTRKYHEEVIKAVIKNNNLATQSQYNTLQRIKNGTFPKYQAGGVPDVSEMGYPGSNSEEKKDLSQDELVNIISNDLNNDIDEQQIAFKLANFYDVDPMEAINLVSQVKNYLIEQNGSDYEYDFDEDENEEDVVEEEVVEEEPYESQEEVDAAEDTQNSSFVTDMLLNEDEEEDDDEEKYGGQMAYGGLYKAQDGEEVEDVDTEIQQNDQVTYPFNPTAPDIVFPEIETYLPYNMADMLNGNVDPATGTYYNHYASKDINQNSEYEDEDNSEEEESDVSSEYALDAPPEMKMGGSYKRNKRIYVNSILKLAKKAEGGEEKKSDEDPEAGDPTGAKIRKQKLNNFIGSLKKETEMFNLKQQAEQQYDQMMQQQQQQIPFQNQMMQNGGSREPRVARGTALRYRANQLKDFITGQNRRNREDNIDYFNVNDYPTSNFEEGDYNKENSNNEMHSYDHPSYSIDVKKSNWLTGRPSKYKIDFYGYSPLVDIANGNNSGVVLQKPLVKPSQSTVSSTVATIINKSQSTDLPKQGTLLPHGFFITDANSDKIPDYLQPGKFSTLPTGASKEVITQAAVNPNATVANTPIISSVYKPEINKNSSPTLIEIKKNKVTVPVNSIPKVISTNKNKNKTITKKTKKKSEYYYRDPTFMERLGRFFDPNLENGGYVDSENPDLYEFNQGGYDPTQQDIDYSNSIDTTDPYFQRGGGVRKFIEDYFPGNIVSPKRTYRNEIQRVYDPRTGKTIVMPMDMGNLSRVHIDKTRFWSGRPKKYTMYFNESTGKPITTSNNVSSQSGRDRFCLDFPNSPNCQGGKKPVKDNYPEDTRENNKNQRSERQGYGFMNDLKLRMQGLDEYGNSIDDSNQGAIRNGDGKLVRDAEGNYYDRYNEKIPDKKRPSDMENWWQNDRYFKQNTKNNEPMSNEELFKSQGKSYDPISKRWLTADQLKTSNILNSKEDEMLPFEQQYMEGNEPIKNNFSNDGSPTEQQYIEDYETYFPAPIPQPAVNPFDFPEFGGEDYWWNGRGSFDQPKTPQPAQEPTQPSESKKKNHNSNLNVKLKDYTYKFDMSGVKDNKDYQQAIARAKNDGVVTEQELANATRMYDSYTAEVEKAKLASMAERVRAQIDRSNASASEKKAAKNKVNAELQRRWNIIDNGIEQRFKTNYQDSTKFGNKQFGGDIEKFLPKKTVGGPPPCGVGEMLDPATNKCKAVSGVLKNNPPNDVPGSPGTIDSWGGTRAAMNPNIPSFANPGTSMKQMMGLDTESMKSFTNPDGTPVGGNTNDPYSIDVKNKRTPLTFGKDNTAVSEARLNMFNAGVDIADSLRRGKESNKAENEMYENLSSNNLYASDPSRDRGDYDTNSGLYRPNEQGQMWNSRSAQYGGYIDEEEYYDPYTEEEDESTYAKGGEKITYMSEDQIRAFMAEGGQVEFL